MDEAQLGQMGHSRSVPASDPDFVSQLKDGGQSLHLSHCCGFNILMQPWLNTAPSRAPIELPTAHQLKSPV